MGVLAEDACPGIVHYIYAVYTIKKGIINTSM